MSNVLPAEGRLNVKRMYTARLLVTASIALFGCACIAFLALLPSYVTLHMGQQPMDAGTAAKIGDADRAEIQKAQNYLSALQQVASATTTASELVAKLLAQQPAGIHIDQISFEAGDPRVLSITGRADATEKIDAYRKALTALSIFKNVSVPVGDLVGAQDGRFSMTIEEEQ